MQKESLKMVIASGSLLCTIIDDVLDFSKLQSGNVDIDRRRASLQELLDGIVHPIEVKAATRGIFFRTSFEKSVPKFIDTDSCRLQQILFNLLGNAIKFSNDGGTVELLVEFIPGNGDEGSGDTESTLTPPQDGGSEPACPFKAVGDDESTSSCPFRRSSPTTDVTSGTASQDAEDVQVGDIVRFKVKDYGRGIDKADLDSIFEPFRQAKGDTQNLYGGTGLGLAITSRLVERLGGTISVESELGKYSEFRVDLPANYGRADPSSLSSRLEKARLIYVCAESSDRLDRGYFEDIGVSCHRFRDATELDRWITTQPGEDSSEFYFLFSHEDCYRDESLEKFKSLGPSALITFGPKHSVPGSQEHFRCLSHLLPYVLIESLVSCMERAGRPKSPKTTDKSPNAHPVSVADLRVLIAEDNVINQKVLRHTLNRLGLKDISIANNGKEAVDMSMENEFDLIFVRSTCVCVFVLLPICIAFETDSCNLLSFPFRVQMDMQMPVME